MGWTGYKGLTAEEVVRLELRGMEIITNSGAWWLVRLNESVDVQWRGYVTLIHALTQRSDGETAIKLVDASMGPIGTPPKSIFRRWLKESAGQERGEYEDEFIQRVQQTLNDADEIGALRPGDEFSLGREIEFMDGTKETTFIYAGKFRARRRGDGALIRLPRNFRKQILLCGATT
jgi:hypothetical protein